MLNQLRAEEVTDLVVIVLLAHHMREAERIATIITRCGTKSRLQDMWPRLKATAKNDEAALCLFTQFIMNMLERGDFTPPPA